MAAILPLTPLGPDPNADGTLAPFAILVLYICGESEMTGSPAPHPLPNRSHDHDEDTVVEAYEVQAYEATLDSTGRRWPSFKCSSSKHWDQYKVETARAEFIQAVAAGEWAVARMKAAMARELEVQFEATGQPTPRNRCGR